MHRRLLPLVVLAVLATACGGSGTVTTSATPPAEDELEEAPDFTVSTLDGGTFALSDGELPTVLNFWAPW